MAHRYKLDAFTEGYVTCALWSSSDDKGNPLDREFGVGDISYATFEQMVKDCESFQRVHGSALAEFSSERAGHDFWLTRNRHGAGFWDGDYPKELGARLTEASHGYGEFNLYVGDDGKIYN
jgi:hypothetical protein